MNVHIIKTNKFNCNINLNELNNFLKGINWDRIKRKNKLHYSSHSTTDFFNLEVVQKNKSNIYLKPIFNNL